MKCDFSRDTHLRDLSFHCSSKIYILLRPIGRVDCYDVNVSAVFFRDVPCYIGGMLIFVEDGFVDLRACRISIAIESVPVIENEFACLFVLEKEQSAVFRIWTFHCNLFFVYTNI